MRLLHRLPPLSSPPTALYSTRDRLRSWAIVKLQGTPVPPTPLLDTLDSAKRNLLGQAGHYSDPPTPRVAGRMAVVAGSLFSPKQIGHAFLALRAALSLGVAVDFVVILLFALKTESILKNIHKWLDGDRWIDGWMERDGFKRQKPVFERSMISNAEQPLRTLSYVTGLVYFLDLAAIFARGLGYKEAVLRTSTVRCSRRAAPFGSH